MNERIKELKHQAFRWYDKNIPEQYSYETRCGDAWEDKFAELIIHDTVKQCAEFAEYQLQIGGTNADKIKQHFGVK